MALMTSSLGAGVVYFVTAPPASPPVSRYVDGLCSSDREDRGDDSSYDSDVEAEGPDIDPEADLDGDRSHHGVSRTSSDTLAAEYAEYVSHGPSPPSPPQSDAGYTARLEFGLKLGYTERLVQAALQKLGPNPAQNELLAELVKLGANAARSPEAPEDVCGGLGPTPGVGVGDDAPPAPPPPPAPPHDDDSLRLRPIVIDGSNVAMSHGNKEVFSCRGIKICVDWFRMRGHKDITVFVPKWRKESSRPDNLVTEQDILYELERDRLLVFTPSRLVGGKRMVCYDDRYILRLAADTDGIVVSNDNYRDLAQESPDYRRVVEERVLMYSFVNDRFMPPDDPLGRSGPTLEQFLRLQTRRGDPPPPCPYAKKCTYGNKCKFDHPERGALPHKSVTERLVEQAQRQLQAAGLQGRTASRDSSPGKQLKGKSLSLPLPDNDSGASCRTFRTKTPLARTRSTATAPTDAEANLHRKLQRQLTLNPSCDPRLHQMRRLVGSPTSPSSTGTPVSPSSPPPQAQPLPLSHPPLSRHSSTEAPPVSPFSRPPPMDHAHVMRIASAPDSYRKWPPPEHRLGAASEPQLHVTATTAASTSAPMDSSWCRPPPMMTPTPPSTSAAGWPSTSLAEARRRLHFHLSYIFPEEQVCAAMQLYPEESDPQKICAAILAMYPKP